jgi:hypothetical protein
MQNTRWNQEHLEKLDQGGASLRNLFVESLGKEMRFGQNNAQQHI